MTLHHINQLSLYEMSDAVRTGRLRPSQIMEACLERIHLREPQVHAWESINVEAALAQAKKLDHEPNRGLLHGLPIGVKDTIDTVDFPTSRGSTIYAGHTTSWDASSVALVKRAGGVILGKTVTTEFAYFKPGKTANPHNLDHTPGGSSSGSAAAVADFMIPVALGTQTAGSLIRPASYCGVIAYKPTLGDFALGGIRPISHSLDTLGVVTRTVLDASLMRSVLLNTHFAPPSAEPQLPPRIAFCHTPSWLEADSLTRAQLEKTVAFLANGNAQVSTVELPSICNELVLAQKQIMAYEAAQYMSYEYDHFQDQLSPQIIALIEDGMATQREDYVLALALTQRAREEISQLFENWDVILAPAAPGEAPHGLTATGDPIFSRMWNLLGLPCLNVPAFKGANQLPVGIQLVGALGEDDHLLRIGSWIEKKLKA